MSTSPQKLWLYAIILHPETEGEQAELLFPLSTIFAQTQTGAEESAALAVPPEYAGRVEVVVRPF